MHSTCVATYNTLITLIIERPTLLDDQENLFELCEIIELGISGEKAQVNFCIKNKNYLFFYIKFRQRKKLFIKNIKNFIQHHNVLLKLLNI
jgi:hypothetical protein